jgi:4-amino-4-deoxy-L-arabinose transferase-like glycosyltransferase
LTVRERLRATSDNTTTTIVLVIFVALWTTYEIVAHGSGDVHNDMAEAWAWGKELQLGYFKHPPFWAWVTYAWFQVFPIEDWSAYLFTALNSAIGIYCVARCNEYFVADRRLAHALAWLLILVPAYTFLAMKMNANTIHLSLWPAIAWAFLAMMERPSAPLALLLGLLGSCAVLSKYNAALFLLCVFAASIVHPAARRFWSSPLPFVVALGGLPIVALHAWWLATNDYLPFRYFEHLQNQTPMGALRGALLFLVAETLYALPALAALLALGRGAGLAAKRFSPHGMNAALLVLALGPLLLSAWFGAAFRTRTPALWGLQNLFLMPALAAQFTRCGDVDRLRRRVLALVVVFLIAAALVSPIVAWAKFNYGDRSAIDPRSQLARELTHWWRTRYSKPLRIVGGNESYALAATFYSPDHPSYYISRDRRLTPWITDARLAEEGALFICNELDDACENEAKTVSADRGEEKKISAVKEFLGRMGQNFDFSFFVIPPKGAGSTPPASPAAPEPRLSSP